MCLEYTTAVGVVYFVSKYHVDINGDGLTKPIIVEKFVSSLDLIIGDMSFNMEYFLAKWKA